MWRGQSVTRMWARVCLLFMCSPLCNGFIQPLLKPDGSVDFDHLLNHMRTLEQSVEVLQQDAHAQNAEMALLKTEIAHLKGQQQKMDANITDMNQVIVKQVLPEVLSLKDEVFATQTEVAVISNQVITVERQMKDLDHKHHALEFLVNVTSSAQKSELNSLKDKFNLLAGQVNSTSTLTNSELLALKLEFRSVSTLKNKTEVLEHELSSSEKEVNNMKTVLGSIVYDVNRAEHDRLLLNNIISRMNSTVSQLQTTLHSNSRTLSNISALASGLDSEVGFQASMRDHVTTSSISTLRYNDVKYNVGGGYDATTGIFTAPVSGTYLFWSDVNNMAGSFVRFYIQATHGDIAASHTPLGGNVTASVVSGARITSGEQVHVTILAASGEEFISTFGGSLLHRH